MVLGAVWFIFAFVLCPIVAVVDFIGVDFVVAALLVSSPEHMKKEQETNREMNWNKRTLFVCCIFMQMLLRLARLICFFHSFVLMLIFCFGSCILTCTNKSEKPNKLK